MIARLVLSALALAASGCVSLLPETEPAQPRYTITAIDGDRLAGAPVDWSLLVDEPSAPRAYDAPKLAVSRTPGRIEYFTGGEWAGRVPRLFQTALIQSFEDSGRILSVGDAAAVPIADYTLQTDVRKIELDVADGGPQAAVEIYARFLSGRGRILAARRFSANEPTPGMGGDEVARAFDAAFDAVLADIGIWAFERGEAAAAEGPGGT